MSSLLLPILQINSRYIQSDKIFHKAEIIHVLPWVKDLRLSRHRIVEVTVVNYDRRCSFQAAELGLIGLAIIYT